VAEAKRLLTQQRELTVEAVAAQTGFGCYRVFCRGFRKFTGVNPGTYRRTVRREHE